MTEPTRLLTWEDVEPAARVGFRVWVGHPELEWARQAWEVLASAGLASYSTEPERARAAIHLISLTDFYLDFCFMACEEGIDLPLPDMIEALGLQSRLIRDLGGEEPDEDDDSGSLLAHVRVMSDEMRPHLFRCLAEGFGGRDSLFCSLWRSAQRQPEPLDTDEDGRFMEPESDADILNDGTPLKMQAYEWLSQAAYPIGTQRTASD